MPHTAEKTTRSMLDKRISAMTGRGKSDMVRDNGNKTIDLSKYRGNLYKQTLSPTWSKTQLQEAKRKFERIPEDVQRNSFENV